MTVKILHFLAIVLTALALVPGGAHLFALPNKIALSQSDYFVSQGSYRGWALFGVAIVAAMLANLAVVVARRADKAASQLAGSAAILIALTLVIFFVWTYPANIATEFWTTAPANWQRLRAEWEVSHAVNAVIMFLALCAAALAALVGRSDRG